MAQLIQWLYKNPNTYVLMIEQIKGLSLKLKVNESNLRGSKRKKRKIENTWSLHSIIHSAKKWSMMMICIIVRIRIRKKYNLVAMISISDIVTNKRLKRRELSCLCSSHSFFPRLSI